VDEEEFRKAGQHLLQEAEEVAAGIVVDPLELFLAVAVVAFAVVAVVAVVSVVAVVAVVAVVSVVAVVAVQQHGVACVDLAVDAAAEVRDHQDLFSEEYDSQVDYVFAYLMH
jgi:hypothetical protein